MWLLSLSLLLGIIEDTANAAEAPQIATAEPDKMPRFMSSLNSFAMSKLNIIVDSTVSTIMINVGRPSSEIS